MKKSLFTLLLVCSLLCGCGSSPSGSQPAETKAETVVATEAVESETVSMTETVVATETELTVSNESEGSSISVDEHLFSVEVTVPGIFFTEEEGVSPTQEELDAIAAENGEGISYTLNEDGTVTCKMSKQKQKEMLDGFKQVVEDSFEEFTTEGSENYLASYKELKYNDDLSEFTITVDPEQYGGFDSFYILVFEMYGYYYQAFAGVPEDDIHVYVYVVDSDGNVIETGDSDALFEEGAGEE